MSNFPKIFIAEAEDFAPEVAELLRNVARVTLNREKIIDLKEYFKEFDIFWFRLGYKIDSNTLPETPRTKIIVCPVTGLDHIDLDLCAKRGIEVISLKGESEFLKEIRATAEHTIALTLFLIRNIFPSIESVLDGKWDRDSFRGTEIHKKNVGIIGMGRLGKIVAEYFNAFGAQILGYDIKKIDFPSYVRQVHSLNDILSNSDIVTIHVDINDTSKNLINDNEFSIFKKNAVLINTSRGGIVNEDALLKALINKKLKGAALDVVKDENSFSSSNELIKYARKNSNLIITPHIGGNTYESFVKTEYFLCNKLIDKIKDTWN